MITLAAGNQHRRRIEQIDHPGRPPRWAQPHDSSTPPCETLRSVFAPNCRGRAAGIAAGYLADRGAGRPCGADIRSRCSAARAAGLERFTYADAAAPARCTRVRCSVRWRCWVAAERAAAARRGPPWVAGDHGRDDVRCARRHVAGAHRRADGRSADRGRRRGGPAPAAVAVRTRPGRCWTPTGWPARRWSRSPRTPPTRRWRRCCGRRSAECPRCWSTAAPTRWTR